ncbi:hypothetical protein SAMN04490189_4560 [Pseudomonas koreensis]|nr:hypothetical protein SAMN04490189_4560 [Pseudomonas koreensis]
MRQIELITTFRWLNMDVRPGIYKIMPTLSIVVGREQIRKFIPRDLERFAGLIEYKHLMSANHLVVCEQEDLDNWDEDLTADQILHIWMLFVEWALQDSWLVKDNCFICEMAYCRLSHSGTIAWSNANLYAQSSTANGDRQALVTFNDAEFDLWASKGLQLRTQLHETGFSIYTPVISKEITRFARFLSFVQISRCASHPAMKISQMCSALESLFSTTTTELTHRLSERVAFFLGGSPVQMEENYQLMKKCYAVRSQVTHGSHVSKAFAKITPDLSEAMLVLLRDITFRILDEIECSSLVAGSDELIEEYFRKRLFFGVH